MNTVLNLVILFLAYQAMCEAWAGEILPLKITSQSTANIFASEQAKLKLSINDRISFKSGEVRISDENDRVLRMLPVPSGSKDFELDLPGKGYYKINAQFQAQDGHAITLETSAAVIGDELPDETRLHSPFGLWSVSGDRVLSRVAGSRWERAMWSISDYKLDSGGHIISIPKFFPKNNKDRPTSWIGVITGGLPNWLKSNDISRDKRGLYPPTDWMLFERLIQRLARDKQYLPEYFEIYNEPDVNWKGSDEQLVEFHKVIAKAIKSVNPGTKVLGPCMYSIRLPYLKKLVNLGLLEHLDGLVMHAYVHGSPPEGEFIQLVIQLREYLASIGHANLPIYITEFGWTTGDGKVWHTPVDELTQAQYVSRSLALLRTQDIKAIVYFLLQYKNAPNAEEAQYSIIHDDQTPKPAYAAFANVAKWLADVSNPRWLKLSETTNLLLFDKGKEGIAVAWDVDDKQAVFLPQVGEKMEDMMGRNLTQAKTLFVTPSPIYFKLKNELAFNLLSKPIIKAKRGDVLALGYEKLWLPAPLSQRSNGEVDIPHDVKSGSYIVFGKRGKEFEVFQVKVK
jgi:hypothetical protein